VTVTDRDRFGLRESVKRCELYRTGYSRTAEPTRVQLKNEAPPQSSSFVPMDPFKGARRRVQCPIQRNGRLSINTVKAISC
jgi:hypothetical protein